MKKLLVSATLFVCYNLGSANMPPLVPVQHSAMDIQCLAENIYHESRGEPFQGQLAVAQVTVNRFQSNRYGKSVCAVVHQPKQFSWTSNKPPIRDKKHWQTSYTMARFVLHGSGLPKFTALFYHNRKVNPQWNRNKTVIKTINNHVFYL
jgi:spore germination cell wall hydrolase CwlJ-like protein